MKTFFLALILTIALFSQMSGSWHIEEEKLIFDTDTIENDSIEYELLIIEPGYDSYLVTQPMKEYYSITYYKNWNKLYVMEWNNQYLTGKRHEIFENEIIYDRSIDYGIDLEYRLYYYFRFIEQKYNITLVARGR